jgi:hypothetical protein
MVSKELGKVVAVVAAAAILAGLPAATAQAQGRRHCNATNVVDGEPTDPDGVLPVFVEDQVELGKDYGLSERDVQDESSTLQAPAWFEAVLDVLRALGLIPAEAGTK